MKIFDFSEGKKGQLLGHAKFGAFGSCRLEDGVLYEISSAHKFTESLTFHNSAHTLGVSSGKYKESEFSPKQLGVGAICTCIGKDNTTGVWIWEVVGTPEWSAEAVKKGILVPRAAYHQHLSPPPAKQSQGVPS
jgi:hypothetical protein